MRWLALVFLATLPAHAETIVVQTGEHSDFSRVVLAPGRATDWSLTRTAQGYRLKFMRDDITFDTRRAFDLIPRTRIEGITAAMEAGALDFALQQDVVASSFETGNGVVVVDFRTDPDSRRASKDSEEPQTLALTKNPLSTLARDESLSTSFFWRGIAPNLATEGSANALDDERSVQQSPLERLPEAPPLADRVAEAERALIEELSRAAAQGLVRIDSTAVPETAKNKQAKTETTGTLAEPEKPAASAPILENDPLSYEMTTAIDRELPKDPEKRSYTSVGSVCLKDSAFDLPKWASDAPASEQIADARRLLVGEFDRADPQAVVALAKLYLALSFGAEAEAVLKSFAPQTREAETLIYLAQVMDDQAVDSGSPILAMLDCDGAVALWALLGSTGVDPNRQMNLSAIQRAFSALPHTLRLAVAERLIERLISSGAKEVAKRVRGIIARIEPEDMPALISDARLDLAHGDTQSAETGLKAVVAGDGTDAVEALLLLVDTQFENGILTDAKTVENVAALAFEHRFAPDGARLARAHVLAATAAEQFDRAVEALMRWPEDDREVRDVVAAQVYEHVTRDAEDIDFLRLSLDHAELWQSVRGEEGLWLDAAERFLSLGFPAQVVEMLDSSFSPSERASVLRAQGYVGVKDGTRALAALTDLTGKKVEEVRAQALSLLVQPVAAAEAFSVSGDLAGASREAWKAGAWGMAAEIGSSAQKEAIESLALLSPMSKPPARSAQDAGLLSQSQELIDESARIRAALQALIKPSS